MQKIKEFLRDTPYRHFSIEIASNDASFRRYFRLTHEDETFVIMDSSLEKSSLEPFIDVTGLMESVNLHAPKIIYEDKQKGFLILEDLGSENLLETLHQDNFKSLYKECIDEIITMQDINANKLPLYDEAFLKTEMNLMPDWFLEKYLQEDLNDELLTILGRLDLDFNEYIKLPMSACTNQDNINHTIEKIDYGQLLNNVNSGMYTFYGKYNNYDLKKVFHIISPDGEAINIYTIHNQYNKINSMSTKNITITNSTINGSVVAAENIENSLNSLQQSTVESEAKVLLKQLLNEIKDLNDKVIGLLKKLENKPFLDNAQKFINTQIKDYERRLSASESRLTSFKQKYSGILPGQSGGYYSNLKSEKGRLEQAELLLKEVETRLASAKAQLLGEEPVFGLFSSKVQSNNSVSTSYDGRITQLEEQLDGLQLRYTNNHPDVKQLLGRIESLNEQRSTEIEKYYESMKSAGSSTQSAISSIDKNPVYQEMKVQVNSLENEAASLTVRVNNYRQRVQSLENKIHTLPEIEAELIALNRGYEITKSKYEELLSRKETAQLAQQADETTDKIQFRVIDPPRAPLKPTGPKRLLFYVVVTFLGAGVGLGISFLFSQINPVVTSSSQVSRATGIPIFGIVSATENIGLQSKDKRKTLLFIVSNTLLLSILCFFIAYTLFPDAIQAPIHRIFNL